MQIKIKNGRHGSSQLVGIASRDAHCTRKAHYNRRFP